MRLIIGNPYAVAIVTMLVLTILIVAIIICRVIMEFIKASGSSLKPDSEKYKAEPVMKYSITGEKKFQRSI